MLHVRVASDAGEPLGYVALPVAWSPARAPARAPHACRACEALRTRGAAEWSGEQCDSGVTDGVPGGVTRRGARTPQASGCGGKSACRICARAYGRGTRVRRVRRDRETRELMSQAAYEADEVDA